MANPKRGEVELELAGDTYTLKFSTSVLAELEHACGGRAVDDFLVGGGNLPVHFVQNAIFLALRQFNRRSSITLKHTARLMDNAMDADEKAYMRMLIAVYTGIMSCRGAKREEMDRVVKIIRRDMDDDFVVEDDDQTAEGGAEESDGPLLARLRSTGTT